jgi:hypothetical protein
LGTPSDAKGSRKKVVAFPHFFGAKVKTLLPRARGAMQAYPGAIADPSFAVLQNLDAFANDVSFAEVEKRLGGKESLACKVLLSVTDEDEKRQLEMFAKKRQGQLQELVMGQLLLFVARIQARELPKEPLVEQVLALSTADADEEEGGTGEQEEADTEKRRTRRKSKQRRKQERQRSHRLLQRREVAVPKRARKRRRRSKRARRRTRE